MQKENTFIISLGGSIIVPENIDIEFLKEFRKVIIEQITTKNQKFVIITGGGKTARNYAKSAGMIVENITNEDKDWLGIHTTRLNAQLIRTIFRDFAYPRINTNPHDLEDFSKCKEPIIIATGWPGPGNYGCGKPGAACLRSAACTGTRCRLGHQRPQPAISNNLRGIRAVGKSKIRV